MSLANIVWSCYDCSAVRIDDKDKGDWMYLSDEAYALLMEEVVFKRKWSLIGTHCKNCYTNLIDYLEIYVNKPQRHDLD